MMAKSEEAVEEKDQTECKIPSEDEGNDEGESGRRSNNWTATEDAILVDYIQKNCFESWTDVAKNSGLSRDGKSCRFRWLNHLRPHLKKGPLSEEEACQIDTLQAMYGNKWAKIAEELPGRTENNVKNFWHSRRRRAGVGNPVYSPGIVPEHSTGSRGFHMLDQHTSGSSPLDLQQEGNFKIPHPIAPFGTPKMGLPSLQRPDAFSGGWSNPLSPFPSAAAPWSLNQPVHAIPAGGPLLKYNFFPRLEKASSEQIADVSTGIVPTRDFDESPYSPPSGIAAFTSKAAEEHQQLDIDADTESNDHDNNRHDG